MRAQLVDWMMEVSASFLVRRRTLQTAVNYCDRYLAACPRAFPRDRLQLLGACVAACLACTRTCMHIHRPSTPPRSSHPALSIPLNSRHRPLRRGQDGGDLPPESPGDGRHHGRGLLRARDLGLRAGAHDRARLEPRAADGGRLGGGVRDRIKIYESWW